jgi:hypothetical protein
MQRCKTCVFWIDTPDKGPVDWGECHFSAPTAIPRSSANPDVHWPRTKAQDGCGQGVDRSMTAPGHNQTEGYLLAMTRQLNDRVSGIEVALERDKEEATALMEKMNTWNNLPWYKKLLSPP